MDTKVVRYVPFCQLCFARYQCKIVAFATANTGPAWTDVCKVHFRKHKCSLGKGRGLRYIN